MKLGPVIKKNERYKRKTEILRKIEILKTFRNIKEKKDIIASQTLANIENWLTGGDSSSYSMMLMSTV